jgi:hypothetical protein
MGETIQQIKDNERFLIFIYCVWIIAVNMNFSFDTFIIVSKLFELLFSFE